MVLYLCYLDTPVEQPLWAQLVLVVPDMLQHGALTAEWGDELEAVTRTETQRPHNVDVVHASHRSHVLWKSFPLHIKTLISEFSITFLSTKSNSFPYKFTLFSSIISDGWTIQTFY